MGDSVGPVQRTCSRLVAWPGFERFIVAVILFNGVLVGVETFPEVMDRWGDELHMANHVILAVFILEALAKMIALGRGWLGYFKSGWNVFDFAVIVLSLIPASGDFATVARLIRLLRVLRLVSALPKLRLLVSTLVSSIPGMANVLLLMCLVFYIYAVAGFHFFHQHDPDKWGTLGDSLLTLFQIVTLDDWGTIMGKGMGGDQQPRRGARARARPAAGAPQPGRDPARAAPHPGDGGEAGGAPRQRRGRGGSRETAGRVNIHED
jgi:voltage-gated sodium channel